MMDEYQRVKFRRWLKDATERVVWTGAQVTLAAVSVEALGLPGWAVAPAATALAVLKTIVAKRVAEDDSASTVTL